MRCFPETRDRGGIIESVLTPIPNMQGHINEKYGSELEGRLLLKQDSHLAIAGSVKARGGIYEVLKHTEDLALEHGLLSEGDSYEKLADEECRKFFQDYTVQVGSTGNLGMSIGIMSAAVGYKAIVHMSADAKQWKKDLLRSHGVTVMEYESDYSEAVKHGRELSDQNPKSYFVDDENSRNLFLGYAVAAETSGEPAEGTERRCGRRAPYVCVHPLWCGWSAGRRDLWFEAGVSGCGTLLFCGADPGTLYAGGNGYRTEQQNFRSGYWADWPDPCGRLGSGKTVWFCGRRYEDDAQWRIDNTGWKAV